jgi:hypothetical protein
MVCVCMKSHCCRSPLRLTCLIGRGRLKIPWLGWSRLKHLLLILTKTEPSYGRDKKRYFLLLASSLVTGMAAGSGDIPANFAVWAAGLFGRALINIFILPVS